MTPAGTCNHAGDKCILQLRGLPRSSLPSDLKRGIRTTAIRRRPINKTLLTSTGSTTAIAGGRSERAWPMCMRIVQCRDDALTEEDEDISIDDIDDPDAFALMLRQVSRVCNLPPAWAAFVTGKIPEEKWRLIWHFSHLQCFTDPRYCSRCWPCAACGMVNLLEGPARITRAPMLMR